jgi:ABC-type xylose transport system permease subunit
VGDLRRIAQRRLPHGVFDYIDGAAEDERTVLANTEAYRTRTFKPRVLRDVSHVDPSTTLLGKRMRALADNLDLAETAAIDTELVVLYTWLFAGALAGLAGVLAGAITNVRPELGFALLLPIFAAVILGGIGDAFGALVGGLVLGVMIEWSTLFIDFRWKTAVGFAVLSAGTGRGAPRV